MAGTKDISLAVVSSGENDFVPYTYNPIANAFARSVDPSIEALRETQSFSYDDFILARSKLEQIAKRTGDQALHQSLSSYKDFKAYLKSREVLCNPLVDESCEPPVPLADYHAFSGKKALHFETYWHSSGNEVTMGDVEIKFLQEIGRRRGYDLDSIEDARLYAQIFSHGSTSIDDNARILIRDPQGHFHLYLLDRTLYLDDLRVEDEGTVKWTNIFSTEAGFELVELYASDGNVLETVCSDQAEKGGARLHLKALSPDQLPDEKSNRGIPLTKAYVERYGNIVRHAIESADSMGKVRRLQPQVLSLTTPEQKLRLIRLLMSWRYPLKKGGELSDKIRTIFELCADSSEVNSIVSELQKTKRPLVIFSKDTGGPSPLQVVTYVSEYELLFDTVDGPKRIELLKVLARKGLTVPVPDMGFIDSTFQAARHFGQSLYELGEMIADPMQLLAIGNFLSLLYGAAIGGRSQLSEGRTMPAEDQLSLVGHLMKGKIRNDFQQMDSVGYGDSYRVEKTGHYILEIVFAGIPALLTSVRKWGKLIITSPKLAWLRGLMLKTGAAAAGGTAAAYAYHRLAEDEYNQMKDYENDLAGCIENAYDNHARWFHKPFLWARRNIFGAPIRTMSQYDHVFTKGSIFEYDSGESNFLSHLAGISPMQMNFVALMVFQRLADNVQDAVSRTKRNILAFFADLFDNDEAAVELYYEGVRRFQEKYSAKYFDRISSDLKRIYQRASAAGLSETAMRDKIEAYIKQNGELISLLNSGSCSSSDNQVFFPLERIGISGLGEIDFKVLFAYLNDR